jgi:hypothetical protein
MELDSAFWVFPSALNTNYEGEGVSITLAQREQATREIAPRQVIELFPGVTDGIEQHIETESEPGGSEGS